MYKTIIPLSLLVALLSLTASVVTLYTQNPLPLFPENINRAWSPPATPSPSPKPKATVPPDFPQPSQIPVVQVSQTINQAADITEAQLWSALTSYRSAHGKHSLVLEESLCVYARKRAAEHQNRFANLSAGESPLDNHAGFQRDADSGSIFEQTGFNTVAEVLAFLPNAQNATQVIEWGWDSSPAHREGLLSNDLTHACIVGSSPFYVGILGKR